MAIFWEGYSNLYDKGELSNPLIYHFPISGDAVLKTAFSTFPLFRISRQAAITSMSKLALRVRLSSTYLNPEWEPVKTSEDFDKIAVYAPDLGQYGVKEEQLSSEVYIVNGVIIKSKLRMFSLVVENNGRYEQIMFPSGIALAIKDAVEAIDINNCPFCLHFQTIKNEFKLINYYAHLTENIEVCKLMSTSPPLEIIEKWSQEILT
jgi:hypothetical protein